MRWLLVASLSLAGCVHQAPRETTLDDDEPVQHGPSLWLIPQLEGGAGELTITLVPPGELPSWSCTARVLAGLTPDFSCGAPREWFHKAGPYEVLVELKRGKGEVIRSVGEVLVDDLTSPLQLTIYGAPDERYHLDFGLMRGGQQMPRPPKTTGSLPKKAIASEIARHKEQIHACYQGELEEKPKLVTRVTAFFVIGPGGKVVSASADGAPGSPALVFCMLAHVRSFKFPSPEGGGVVPVAFPWVLTPPGYSGPPPP